MITVSLSKQVEDWTKELRKFADNIQNNIHVGALRVAANVVKEEMKYTPMETTGDNGVYKKNLQMNDMFVRKRRRTKTGWDRFKIAIKHPRDPVQVKGERKAWHYDIIANSEGKKRTTKKGGKNRGALKKDEFIQRASEKATDKALRGYIYYLKTRILSGGAKLSAKTVSNAKKSGF